eukprot:TRINITY_DN80535_c0_g1_i1.p2 TRINITY_DN80535_c0_g1~~TRINITY_DN80535_c0_g1_i1.p2  ORF type:complete len:176 (-),score=32.50 TRINITY_DN80535_c0_g1_i1:38-565(-)
MTFACPVTTSVGAGFGGAALSGDRPPRGGDLLEREGERPPPPPPRLGGDDGDRCLLEGDLFRAAGEGRLERERDCCRLDGERLRGVGERLRGDGERLRGVGDRFRLDGDRCFRREGDLEAARRLGGDAALLGGERSRDRLLESPLPLCFLGGDLRLDLDRDPMLLHNGRYPSQQD